MDFVLSKVDKQLENYRSLDQHMKYLKRKLKELNGLKDDINSRVSAELRPRKKLKTEVHIWLENVEIINGEVQKLDGLIGESSAITRGFHAENVLKRIREVEELNQQGKFHEGLVVDNPQWIGQVLSTRSLSGEAAKASVDEIWQYLMDDEVLKIGVWGMGGVGKTYIMKNINNQLIEEKGKFDIVIWNAVSKDTSIARLQENIADKIKVEFSGDEDEITRAGKLFEKLSGKRFVVILDDLWEKISLEIIGIPEPSSGSKLVLTTRSFDVCRQVGCSRAVKIKPLMEEEAWNLFSEEVGGDILNIPGLKPIAKSVAERCAGLPLGVVTVATCMRGIDDLSEWRNALNELSVGKKSVNGLEDEVFQQLLFSYDRLKDLKLQRCFLSCALYPEDRIIKEADLIRLWIAEGLVEEMDSRQAEFDRGHAIMNRLISNCLLEVHTLEYGWDDERYVKMHDLIRDVALHITSAKPRFLVKAGMTLTEPPNVQEWSRDLEKVSLMENWKLRIHYPLEMSSPKCSMLTTLLLSDCGIDSIPEGFFKHMDALKILDLSRNPIKSLPNSFSNLENLTALLLSGCLDLTNVPSLSNLRVLKDLDLKDTYIKEVPRGMQNSSSLKYLNLDGTRNLVEIPSGILSTLSCLQDLIVGETLIRAEEVCGLNKLEILEGKFYDLHNLNMYVQALHGREEPREYKILVGEEIDEFCPNTRKSIQLGDCNIDTDRIMLPRDIKELSICYCYRDCSEEYPLFSRFILVSLGTFSSLEFLEIHSCGYMKKLFSPNCVPLNLQELCLADCLELEEIIASEVESEGRGMVTTEFRLPQLRLLILRDLPELKSICNVDGVVVCDSLEKIWVRDCPKLKRMPLNLPQLYNARPSAVSPLSLTICPEEWWESVEWDHHPNAKSILKPSFWHW